jgi:hypothetical protein
MDYVGPAILFLVGLVAFLFASGVWKWGFRIRRSAGLAVEDGAVRLDLLGRPTPKGEKLGTVLEEGTVVPPAPDKASRSRRPRARGRR